MPGVYISDRGYDLGQILETAMGATNLYLLSGLENALCEILWSMVSLMVTSLLIQNDI